VLQHRHPVRHHQAAARRGLIVESARRPAAAPDDARRRDYRLTDFGRHVAIAEARPLEEMVAVVRATRLLDEPGTA
jgi:hypothetical protein